MLDQLTNSGCVLGQYTILDTKQGATFCARTISESNCLVINLDDIEDLRVGLKDLDIAIQTEYDRLQVEGHPHVDY